MDNDSVNESSRYRILVTGYRHWKDPAVIYKALTTHIADSPFGTNHVTIVHKNSGGADRTAEKYAVDFSIRSERHVANWRKYGKAAGPLRNQEMVDAGADICLAFLDPLSVGTKDCLQRAAVAGIPIARFYA